MSSNKKEVKTFEEYIVSSNKKEDKTFEEYIVSSNKKEVKSRIMLSSEFSCNMGFYSCTGASE